jgi:hypothetical protein
LFLVLLTGAVFKGTLFGTVSLIYLLCSLEMSICSLEQFLHSCEKERKENAHWSTVLRSLEHCFTLTGALFTLTGALFYAHWSTGYAHWSAIYAHWNGNINEHYSYINTCLYELRDFDCFHVVRR